MRHCNFLLLELLRRVGAVADQELRVHVFGESLHHFERRDPFFVVYGWVPVLIEKRSAVAQIHVHECEPGRFPRRAEGIVHYAGLFDDLRCLEQFHIGFRNFNSEFIEDVFPVHQVLGIDHHGDCHDLAVHAIKLGWLQVLAVFLDQIVQRPNQVRVHQRHGSRAVKAAEVIQGRISRKPLLHFLQKLVVQFGLNVTALLHRLRNGDPSGHASRDRANFSLVFIRAFRVRGEGRPDAERSANRN